MTTQKKLNPDTSPKSGTQQAEDAWKAGWTHVRTVVDTLREPFMMLDKDLRVIAANETFYRTFYMSASETEGKLLPEIGDGQWNSAALQKLLNEIVSQDTFFRGFKLDHVFPLIGRKVMLLNARRIHHSLDSDSHQIEPVILLAIEDITEINSIAEKVSGHTRD